MANDLGGNPWVVDTNATVAPGQTFVRAFLYKGAAGQSVSVTDANSRIVFEAAATAEVPQFGLNVGTHINGLTVAITGGGKLLIYV